MTNDEFGKIAERIEKIWVGKFNEEHLRVLWENLARRIPFDDLDLAVTIRAAIPSMTSIGDIIQSANEITIAKARKRATPKWTCHSCEGTGMVSTVDPDGYAVVFRCKCLAKPLSESIAMWDAKFEKIGYKPVFAYQNGNVYL